MEFSCDRSQPAFVLSIFCIN
jgi:hypothetical protein